MNQLFKTGILLIALMAFISANSFSQNLTSSLYGHIVNKETNEPEMGCVVVVVELNMWGMTDMKGFYRIDKIPTGGEYTIQTSSLGLESYEKKFAFKESKEYMLDIELDRMSFEMDEVVVTAEEKKGLGSSSSISQEAMEHLQPTSLKDVMQLLPGQVSSNPDLSSVAQISLRDIANDANSSLGTAIIVDGAPVSNNGDLQVKNTSNASVAGGGIDVRQISTDNIESVEVIRGIASVQYGDMTSGAVIVKTKAGASPLRAKVSVNPNVKKVNIGKGIRLKKEAGAVNINMDYTSSIDSKITPYRGFKRITAQLGYSKTFMNSTIPLSLNLTTKYFQTIDTEKNDPDLFKKDEEYTSSDKGLKVGLNGRWNLKNLFVTNLNYTFSSSLNVQRLYDKEVISLGYIQPVSNARINTIMEGEYAPSEYYSEMTIDGRPFNVFAKLVASKILRNNGVLNNILYGFDYRSSGNNGKGRQYDELRPPRLSGGNATRPRPYDAIPSLNQFSLFLSDNLTLPIGNTKLFMEAGVRYNNYQPTDFLHGEIETVLEPRFNLKYEILNEKNNTLFDRLAFFGGYGLHSKSPTLLHLYPDLAYFDLNSFNYFASDPAERLLLVTTRVLETSNENLVPIKNNKYEMGAEGKIKKINFKVNAYYENQENGLKFSNQIAFLEFYKWNLDDPNIIYQSGLSPIVDLQNPTVIDTFIASYGKPDNTNTFIKKGIEYVVNFDEIKSIKTKLNITGAYKITRTYTNKETQTLPYGNGATQLPYVGVYSAGSGNELTLFNTNLMAITHIPKLRLIFSTTFQVIWKKSMEYFLGGDQPWSYTNTTDTYIVKAPIALIDKAGIRHDVSKEEILMQEYDYYLSKYDDEFFDVENQPAHYQINLKVTSEIGKEAKFSFFANNITMHNPKYKSKRTNSMITLNSPIYFGLELTLLF